MKKKERTTALSFRLPKSLIRQVDQICMAEERSRVQGVRILLREAVAARESKLIAKATWDDKEAAE